MGRRVKVALVMPVRNEENSVDATMAAVFASTRLPDEIIVADGMSNDRTVEKIMAYRRGDTDLRVLPNPTLFAGGGRNIGVRNTSCEIILLADFGNLLDSRWIEEMVKPFEERDDVDIVAGMFRPLVKSDFEHCMAAINYFHDYVLDRYTAEEKTALVPKVVLPGGLSIGMTRKIWEKAGGFPEWLHKAQDKLFSRKAHCVGARVCVAWNAFIFHHMRRTAKDIFMQLFLYGRGNGQGRYVDRHFLKLAAFYGLLLGLIASARTVPVAGAAALVLFAVYIYRSGIRKVVMVDGGLKHLRYLWIATTVLISRDLGSLLGHAAGWGEWLLVPRFRRLFREYAKGCDGGRLHILAR